MKYRIKYWIVCALYVLAILVVIYIAVMPSVWQIRNPLGNNMTFWTYMPAPLLFQAHPDLQVKPCPTTTPTP